MNQVVFFLSYIFNIICINLYFIICILSYVFIMHRKETIMDDNKETYYRAHMMLSPKEFTWATKSKILARQHLKINM